MKYEIELTSGGRDWIDNDGQPTELGLVVCEHVDKIGFSEPTIIVTEKVLLPFSIRFLIECTSETTASLAEIIRGYRIGCFRIAREYGLISTNDSNPIFDPEVTIRSLPL